MTVEEMEAAVKRMSAAYDQIVAVLDANDLDRGMAVSLMAQITCQLFEGDKESFIHNMERFYNMERFLRPQSEEIH